MVIDAVSACCMAEVHVMQGKKLLRQWVEAPTWDKEELERRQAPRTIRYYHGLSRKVKNSTTLFGSSLLCRLLLGQARNI